MNIDFYVLCLTHNLWVTSRISILTSELHKAYRYKSLDTIPSSYKESDKYKIVMWHNIEPGMGTGITIETIKEDKPFYVVYFKEYKKYFKDIGKNTKSIYNAKRFDTYNEAYELINDWSWVKFAKIIEYRIEIEDDNQDTTNTEDVNDLITNMRQEIDDLKNRIKAKDVLLNKSHIKYNMLVNAIEDLINSKTDDK